MGELGRGGLETGQKRKIFQSDTGKTPSPSSLRRHRERLWRPPAGRLATLGAAARYVERVGLCLLFGGSSLPLPKLHEAARCGYEWWPWKDLLQARRLAFLGRPIRGRATLIAARLLPAFLALHRAEGGSWVYDEDHFYGHLPELGKRIGDFLSERGPTAVDSLRKALAPRGKAGTRKFHGALLEMQRRYHLAVAGLEERGWGVRVLEVMPRWLPEGLAARADSLSEEEAAGEVLGALLHLAGALPEREAVSLLGWRPERVRAAGERLLDGGGIRRLSLGRGEAWLSCP